MNLNYPDFPSNYIPETVLIYDHLGLLVKIERNQITQQNYRPADFKPQLITWFFDGTKPINVAYAHSNKTVLVNRIGNLQALQDLNQVLKGN
ncbi:MAG: hypothetical protein WBM86_13235 [Waterburya sp.]